MGPRRCLLVFDHLLSLTTAFRSSGATSSQLCSHPPRTCRCCLARRAISSPEMAFAPQLPSRIPSAAPRRAKAPAADRATRGKEAGIESW